MLVSSLLSAFHRARDAGDRAALAQLFGETGLLVLCGETRREARGADAVSLLEQWEQGEALVFGPQVPWLDGGIAVAYAWQRAPERVAGELLLIGAEGRIGRLELYPLPGGPALPRERVSVRAVLLAPGPRVLLFECHEPGKPGSWWITPGGGREAGETDEAALRRELREEVGIELSSVGPCVWTRTHTFIWQGAAIRQHERFYVVTLEREVPLAPSAVDAGTLGHRWWTLEALEATDALLAPRQLSRLLAAWLREGPPDEPIDAGL